MALSPGDYTALTQPPDLCATKAAPALHCVVCVCVCNILLIVFLCYYSNPDFLRIPSPVCPPATTAHPLSHFPTVFPSRPSRLISLDLATPGREQ